MQGSGFPTTPSPPRPAPAPTSGAPPPPTAAPTGAAGAGGAASSSSASGAKRTRAATSRGRGGAAGRRGAAAGGYRLVRCAMHDPRRGRVTFSILCLSRRGADSRIPGEGGGRRGAAGLQGWQGSGGDVAPPRSDCGRYCPKDCVWRCGGGCRVTLRPEERLPRVAVCYRGTSLTRNTAPLATCSRTMPGVMWLS